MAAALEIWHNLNVGDLGIWRFAFRNGQRHSKSYRGLSVMVKDKKNAAIELLLLFIIFDFNSSISHGCSSKIKLIIYSNLYIKRKTKCLNLWTWNSCMSSLKHIARHSTYFRLILLGSFFNISFASSMNVKLFKFWSMRWLLASSFLMFWLFF